MKKITLLSAIAMIAFTVNSFGQVTVDGTSTTTVVAPIAIEAKNPLAFGHVTENGSGGTITLTASATPTISGASGALPVGGTNSTFSAGSFTVTGETGKVFDISLPATTTTLNGAITNSTHKIEVSGLNTSATTGTIGDASATFYVGGIITLIGGQTVDSYTGTYKVTVQYQ